MSTMLDRAKLTAEYYRLRDLLKEFKRQRDKDKHKIAVVGVTRIEKSMEDIGRKMTSMGWKL